MKPCLDGHDWLDIDGGPQCINCGLIKDVEPMTDRQIADEIASVRSRIAALEKIAGMALRNAEPEITTKVRRVTPHPDCPVCEAKRRKNAERMRIARATKSEKKDNT